MPDAISELSAYSLSDIARMGYPFVLTKLFLPDARLARRPASTRGKKEYHAVSRSSTELAVSKIGDIVHFRV